MMNGWMGGWMNGCKKECLNGLMNGYIQTNLCLCINKHMNEWVDVWMYV